MLAADSLLLLRGLVIGFVIAAPVGPVGLLCIRRALADGHLAAFVAGLGAAVADTFYGAVAGYGLTYISHLLLDHETTLRLVGGLFVCLLGWRTFKAVPVLAAAPTRGPGLLRDFASTTLITLTNPATILAFMGVFAAMSDMGVAFTMREAHVLVVGVFLGSALWWFLLAAGAGAVRSRFNEEWLLMLNRISGVLLGVFGIGLIASLLL